MKFLQTSVPEAMFMDGGEKFINQIEELENAVYGIGPGLGIEKDTEKAMLKFLENHQAPLILDADALNIISKDKVYLELILKNQLSHRIRKNLERLFRKNGKVELKDLAKTKAKELEIYIVF
ncbi:NAD(P)H-hydrate dehydratase [Chryseobacterium indoltheticum]|uniref:NAD(P)H-hydrate dehydratase n=1 Tax=Chryseobacterium indoltheticum TaxID=254 RepID=UPI003F497E3A